MTILAGEEVEKESTFWCQQCGHELRANKGQSIPKCGYCGHDIFDDGSTDDTIH